jgi:class 3 adenylate cyclase/predicted ATPase
MEIGTKPEATAVDVASWLRNLDLERYEAAFRENDVGADVLRDLTAEDLEGLGVATIGHRRQLLVAIAKLRDGAPQAVRPTDDPLPSLSAGERRQLTVMFCDLVGSTALSEKLDPEELRSLLHAYRILCGDVISRYDGFVARYVGDGILTYFGWPTAHEEDAERAVRAALEIAHTIRRASSTEDLSIRIGIATGPVVVGEAAGSGDQSKLAVGSTPNLAARLQGLAAADQIVIADGTHRQIGGLFEFADLGSKSLAGFAEPQHVWQVLGESGVLSRFEALRAGTSPLVGRAEELDLLARRWKRAKTGEGQVVLLSGEAGIGKSRLIAALSEHIRTEAHVRLRYFCSPYHQDSALWPVIVQLEHAAGFTRGDTAEAKHRKLRALLAPGARDDDDIPLLSELLSLPSSAADLNLSPRRKREKLFEAMLSQLETEALRRPLLMLFEDTHWIDPSTRELLDLTVDRIRRLPALLLITFRPEFPPPWGGRSYVTSLALNRLGDRDGEALVRGLAEGAALSPSIVAEIVERADGVPLFAEELTKAVLESANRDNRVAAVLAATLPMALSVPATLHTLLMARLDRLGPTAREVAQIGAVLGREFAYELIEPVARLPEKELRAALDQLGDAELLFCRGIPPHSTYLFKHSLVQDAAYSTLLSVRRQELHARVAAALEVHFADLIERQPELLAHHLTSAGNVEHAADQWLKAGRLAAARLAYLEAIAHFERGLGVLPALPEGPVRDGRELALQLALGLCLYTAKGAADAKPCYVRALALAESRGDPHEQFEALFGMWQSIFTIEGPVSRPFSNRLLRMAEQVGDDGSRLQAHHSVWSTSWLCGEPAKSRAHAEAGRCLYDPAQHSSHRLVYGGHDPGVCAGYVGACAEWLVGYPEKALASIGGALALAERIGHPFTLLGALCWASMLSLNRREPDLAQSHLEVAGALAAEQRLAFPMEPGILHGAALLGQGAVGEAITRIRNGTNEWIGLGRTALLPYGFAFLAEGLAQRGDHASALTALGEGLASADATGQHLWDAELHRLTGTMLLAKNKRDEAQMSLQRAIRVAQAQQAKSLELRAATSLARLLGEQGQRTEAMELLASVYGWFTEGFDTKDLQDAKSLLTELE